MTEDGFLDQLKQDAVPVGQLIKKLDKHWKSGAEDEALTWANLLQENMVQKADLLGAIDVVIQRAHWAKARKDKNFTTKCQSELEAMLDEDRNLKKLIAHIALGDRKVLCSESLRRLKVLLSLKPGVICYDKTWGVGVIREIDYFYKKIGIDFEKKCGHYLAFGYAGETLVLLPEDHLLTRFHHDKDAVSKMAVEQPDELVRMTLKSFGPLPIELIQEHLVPRIVEEKNWKTFWNAARKGLKKDANVEIPKKRSDPIRFIEAGDRFGDKWFDKLAKNRDMEKILESIDDYKTQLAEGTTPEPEYLDIMADRLAFAIKGAGMRHPALTSRASMQAQDLDIPAEKVDCKAIFDEFLFNEEHILNLSTNMPAKYLRPFFERLIAHDQDSTCEMLMKLLDKFHYTVMSESIQLLLEQGREEACAQKIRAPFEKRVVHAKILTWVFRNREYIKKWNLGSLPELAKIVISALEADAMHEDLRIQNTLRDICADEVWLKEILDSMTDLQRNEFMARVKESTAWQYLDRNSVLGKMIRLYPGLQQIMEAGKSPEEEKKLTSTRRYQERKAQLEHIIKVEIPDNAREIGEARSHGDLRENFEYKVAKERQRMLQHTIERMTHELAQVQPSNFDHAATDIAGIATKVRIRYTADNREEEYCILGEWDNDSELNIIAGSSLMAQRLTGLRPGKKALVPGETQEQEVKLLDVAVLPDRIRRWIRGED